MAKWKPPTIPVGVAEDQDRLPLFFRIPQTLKEALADESQVTGISVAALARDMIWQCLSDRGYELDRPIATKARGVAGE